MLRDNTFNLVNNAVLAHVVRVAVVSNYASFLAAAKPLVFVARLNAMSPSKTLVLYLGN